MAEQEIARIVFDLREHHVFDRIKRQWRATALGVTAVVPADSLGFPDFARASVI